MRRIGLLLLVGLALAGASYAGLRWDTERLTARWHELADPGPLAAAHARLDGRCLACHTPLLGPDAVKCTACHADDRALLQRQSTAFHAYIGQCRGCHLEHLGRAHVSRRMDHDVLARIAEQPTAASLDCAACHARRDRHQGQFGGDCAGCHGTSSWRVAGYLHPSASSTDCAQCHLEPPSHRMMHFEMVSKMVAGQEHATVRQCYLCHQPTGWNDIKGVGWYKHH
jgi:hypothetical protein